MNIDDPLRLVYVLATLLDIRAADKQVILEEQDIVKKLQAVATRAHARSLAARTEGQDRIEGPAGDDRRAAPSISCASR